MGPGPKRADTSTRQAPSGFGRSWRFGVNKTERHALLSGIDQVNVTSRLLPCMRFDVFTESLLFSDK